MTGSHRTPEELLRGLAPPEPPAELRHGVLRAARHAMAAPAKQDLWTLLWQSPTARLAWALAVTALVVGHLAITPRTRADSPARTTSARALAGDSPELAELAELPPIRLVDLVWAGEGRGSGNRRDMRANNGTEDLS